ncbi:hypothetical protein MtrunA17_Chr5g0422911 [Medicago truncatula]|nr:hypothetical protein MtrunA17_Chr5g0422911 [Medicago truncatula]
MYLQIILGRVGGLFSLFDLVVVYSGVGRLLLVTGGCLFTIQVVFPLQTCVAARVLLLGFIFLLICVWVSTCFLARWFGGVVFVSFNGLWVYSQWLLLRTSMVMFAAFRVVFRPRCHALAPAEPWCCKGGGGGDA